MPWVTLEQLKDQVADDNDKKSPSDLGINDGALTAALNSGQADIRDALLGNGYQSAQIEAGDRLYEYHLRQSRYHLYTPRVASKGGDPKTLDYFNVAKTLVREKNGWAIAGVLVFPGVGANPSDAGGSVGYGMTGLTGADQATIDSITTIRNTFAKW